MDKKISVIIPIYNAEKFLGATLNCICNQTHKNLEIICVLDCPTDGSEKIARDFAARDARIKIIRNEKNMDLANTRNIGAAAATGDYIHFMDADDLISPDFYELLAFAAARTDSDVAACDVFYEKKPRHSIWFKKPETIDGKNEKIRKSEVTVHGWAWRWLIRREFWNAHNLEFPNLRPLEDSPVIIPMVYYANRIALTPGAVYFYKNREGSILNQKRNPEREKLYHENRHKARAIYRKFMREHGLRKPFRLLYSIKKRIWA